MHPIRLWQEGLKTASVTADTFKDLMNLPLLDSEDAEKILDMAIDCLNLYGQLDMSNMAGTAGSKTLNLTSQQKAALLIVARAIYYGFYVDLSSTQRAGIAATPPSDLMANSIVYESLREAARLLQEPEYSRAFLR